MVRAPLLRFAPAKAVDNKHLSALVRSLAAHLDAQDVLRPRAVSRTDRLAGAYRDHLAQVRGYADRTVNSHAALARELLSFLASERRLCRHLDVGSAGSG